MENWLIRKIEKRDNQSVAKLIRSVFDELNIPKVGTAYADPYLDLMYEEMMATCLQSAKDFGFESCYLETMPYMLGAQKLYKKVGFEYIDSPMGCTGHTSCPVWMLKKL